MEYHLRPLVWLLETSVSTQITLHLSVKKNMCGAAAGLNCSQKNTASSVYICLPYYSGPGIERYVELRLSAPLHGNQQTTLGAEQVHFAGISTDISTYEAPMLTQG